jgi:hypothetical protein
LFNSIIFIIFEQYKNLRIWIDTQRKTIQKKNKQKKATTPTTITTTTTKINNKYKQQQI